MAEDADRPIIRKKVVVSGHGHHGGAWKVAYADFVTAMMAFFLLLWLLGSTSSEQRDALADYFNPNIPLIDTSGGGSSFFGGDSAYVEDEMAQSGVGGSNTQEGEGDEEGGVEEQTERRQVVDFVTAPEAAAMARLEEQEAALEERLAEVEAERAALEQTRSALEAALETAIESPEAAAEAAERLAAERAAAEAEAERLAERLARSGADGGVEEGDGGGLSGAAAAEADARDQQTFAQIESAFAALQQEASANPVLDHLLVRRSPDGLTIEIAETDGESLFQRGSAEPSPAMRALMSIIAPIIEVVANDLAVVGHTDATPFASGSGYSNWELSADRANAARRLLQELGVGEERFAKISGAADRDPLVPEDPQAAQNRRIGVTLLTWRAARRERGDESRP